MEGMSRSFTVGELFVNSHILVTLFEYSFSAPDVRTAIVYFPVFRNRTAALDKADGGVLAAVRGHLEDRGTRQLRHDLLLARVFHADNGRGPLCSGYIVLPSLRRARVRVLPVSLTRDDPDV